MAIGSHVELQHMAAKTLEDSEPLTHDELKQKTAINSREVMQAVIRGLSDNGVTEVIRSYPDEWKYTVHDDANPDQIYSDVK